MALLNFARFGSRRPKATGDPFDILGDLVPWQEAVDSRAAKLAHAGMRNKIVNGGFRVNQRGYVSAAALGSGVFGLDRWAQTTATATTLTFAGLAGAANVVTVNAGGIIGQVIERANMPAGRYVLSHQGTAHARVYKAGTAPPAFAAAPFVVDLDGTGNVVVELTGNGGAAKTIDRVQLEQVEATGVAEDASPFEQRPLSLEQELCRWFFQRIGGQGVNNPIAAGFNDTATSADFTLPLLSPMRAAPSMTPSSPTGLRVVQGGGSLNGTTGLSLLAASTTHALVHATFAALTAGAASRLDTGGTNGHLDFSAELLP